MVYQCVKNQNIFCVQKVYVILLTYQSTLRWQQRTEDSYLMNTYFTVNKSKHKTSIDLYEKSASQNYLTVLVFSELLKHIIEWQTFLTSNIFWIVRYRILFINYFSKYALKWLLLNYMFMLLNRQLFEKIFIDILENTYTEYIKIAFWTV